MDNIETFNGYAPIDTVASAMGIGKMTLRGHVKRKGIKVVRFGWNTLIRPEDVANYKPRGYSYQTTKRQVK